VILISVLQYFCVWQSSAVFYFVQDPFMAIYYVFCSTNAWLVNSERMTHENIHTTFV